MELKDKIKQLRKEYNLSLQKFAQLLDVTDTAVLKWEQGKTEPKASNLKAIAKTFNIDLMDFLEIDYQEQKRTIAINNSFNNNKGKQNIKF